MSKPRRKKKLSATTTIAELRRRLLDYYEVTSFEDLVGLECPCDDFVTEAAFDPDFWYVDPPAGSHSGRNYFLCTDGILVVPTEATDERVVIGGLPYESRRSTVAAEIEGEIMYLKQQTKNASRFLARVKTGSS